MSPMTPLASPANISQSFTDQGVNISQAHCRATEDGRAVNTFHASVRDLDQLKQEKVLAKWDSWGQGFVKTDMFTEVLYDSLKNKPTGPKNSHGHITK